MNSPRLRAFGVFALEFLEKECPVSAKTGINR
jgi:hypothetical protein